MKKLLFLLIIMYAFANVSKADTIDFWHIYYNNVEIKEGNEYSKFVLKLNIDKIKNTDSLSFRYYHDSPCFDCATNLIVEDKHQQLIIKARGEGNFNPITFKLKYLIEYFNLHGETDFKVYYYREIKNHKIYKIPVFSIKLE